MSYESAGPAVTLVMDEGAPDRLAAAIGATGGRIAARIDWEALASGGSVSGDVIVAEAAGVALDRLGDALPVLAARAGEAGAALVIAFDRARIDIVAAAMLGSGATLLCDPDSLDCATAIALAGGGAGHHGVVREGEAERLDRLNAEIARIAGLLARLARGEPDGPATPAFLGDRTLDYGAQPAATEPVRAADVRGAIRARRLRDSMFGAGLFEDPAWDMLLDLFAAELEQARVSVSSLCIAAAVAPTTALRWIARLAEAGLLIREPDPSDRRRAFMRLSPSASSAMRAYWAAATRTGAAIS